MSVWIASGLFALCGALTYAELSAMLPRTGGIYVYLRRAFGPIPAFLFGWAELWMLRPAAYGAIAITCAEYGWRLIGADGSLALVGQISRAQVTAATLIVIVGIVNIRGIDLGAVIQNTSTLLKCIAIVALVGIGASWAIGGNAPATAAVDLQQNRCLATARRRAIDIQHVALVPAGVGQVGHDLHGARTPRHEAQVVLARYLVDQRRHARNGYVTQVRGAERVPQGVLEHRACPARAGRHGQQSGRRGDEQQARQSPAFPGKRLRHRGDRE
jgi:hypothetical protein